MPSLAELAMAAKLTACGTHALGTYVPPEVTCVVVATVETGGPLWWPKCPKVIRCRSPASTPSEFHGAWSRPMASSSWGR